MLCGRSDPYTTVACNPLRTASRNRSHSNEVEGCDSQSSAAVERRSASDWAVEKGTTGSGGEEEEEEDDEDAEAAIAAACCRPVMKGGGGV